MDMDAGRGACEDAHGWDPGHLALPGEDATRTSVTARNCASPRRCQRLGTRWLEGRDLGTAPRPPHAHPCATIQPGRSTGQIKDSSFLLGGRRTPNTSLGCALVDRTAGKTSTSSLCIQPCTPGGVTMPASSEECWTYCQGRIPVWFLSLGRCELEDAIAEPLWGCFPLLLA